MDASNVWETHLRIWWIWVWTIAPAFNVEHFLYKKWNTFMRSECRMYITNYNAINAMDHISVLLLPQSFWYSFSWLKPVYIYYNNSLSLCFHSLLVGIISQQTIRKLAQGTLRSLHSSSLSPCVELVSKFNLWLTHIIRPACLVQVLC